MPKFKFSGAWTRCEIPELTALFGPIVPFEAFDLIFTAPDDMTMLEARENLKQMAEEWKKILEE